MGNMVYNSDKPSLNLTVSPNMMTVRFFTPYILYIVIIVENLGLYVLYPGLYKHYMHTNTVQHTNLAALTHAQTSSANYVESTC